MCGSVGQTESASPHLVRLSCLLGKCGEGDRVGLTLIPEAAGAGVRWGEGWGWGEVVRGEGGVRCGVVGSLPLSHKTVPPSVPHDRESNWANIFAFCMLNVALGKVLIRRTALG